MKKRIKINFDLIKILISTLLFITSLFLKNYFALYLTLIILAYIIASYELYIKAFKNIVKKEYFDENLLMIIATIGAFCIKEYQEAIIVILLYQLGEYLSDTASDRSKDSISELLDLRSDKINLKVGREYKQEDTKKAALGDYFLVKPGELIPLDGIVVDGESNIDNSSLTGESIPVAIKKGDTILSGGINLSSPIIVQATSTYTTSTSAKIIALLENSEDSKAKSERFITRFSKVYTPIVVIIAVLTFLIATLVFKQDYNAWLYRSLELLVISCPCALVISIPLSFFCGIGKCSKEGILVKGGNELDKLTKIKILGLDKTGTLTKGSFILKEVNAIGNYDTQTLLDIIVHAEYYSNHPIAKAIVANYNKAINPTRITNYKELPGFGIKVTVDDKEILLGNNKLLELNKIKINNGNNQLLYLAINNKYEANILIDDNIKDNAHHLKRQLIKEGVEVAILSGDNAENTQIIAEKLGITNYYSSLLPQDKVEKIKELKETGFTGFVGDGINDAPVIKEADIGISMGGIGADATIEASDIVLMNDDLNSLIKSIKIAKLTKRVIIFNISFAIIFKFVMMILAILGITSMYLAVFADVGVTLILILHSLTIFKRKIKTY